MTAACLLRRFHFILPIGFDAAQLLLTWHFNFTFIVARQPIPPFLHFEGKYFAARRKTGDGRRYSN